MAILLEREIEKAIEQRLARPRPVPARAPVVRFSPMFAEPPAGARKKRAILFWVSVAVHVVLIVVLTLMPQRGPTLADPSLPISITNAVNVHWLPQCLCQDH